MNSGELTDDIYCNLIELIVEHYDRNNVKMKCNFRDACDTDRYHLVNFSIIPLSIF